MGWKGPFLFVFVCVCDCVCVLKSWSVHFVDTGFHVLITVPMMFISCLHPPKTNEFPGMPASFCLHQRFVLSHTICQTGETVNTLGLAFRTTFTVTYSMEWSKISEQLCYSVSTCWHRRMWKKALHMNFMLIYMCKRCFCLVGPFNNVVFWLKQCLGAISHGRTLPCECGFCPHIFPLLREREGEGEREGCVEVIV